MKKLNINKINIPQNNKNWGSPRRTACFGTWCFSVLLVYRKMCADVKNIGAFIGSTASCHPPASNILKCAFFFCAK